MHTNDLKEALEILKSLPPESERIASAQEYIKSEGITTKHFPIDYRNTGFEEIWVYIEGAYKRDDDMPKNINDICDEIRNMESYGYALTDTMFSYLVDEDKVQRNIEFLYRRAMSIMSFSDEISSTSCERKNRKGACVDLYLTFNKKSPPQEILHQTSLANLSKAHQ